MILDAAKVFDSLRKMVLDDAVLNDLFVHYLHVDGVKVDLGEEIVRRVIGEDGAAVCEEMIDERI